MADKNENPSDGEQNIENTNNEREGDANDRNLETFITEHYEKQKDAGKMDATDELGDERTANFFARAIAESRRMNSEVQKSNKKLDALHQEFGMELVNSWQAEHASEVLQPHEAELVKRASYQSQS